MSLANSIEFVKSAFEKYGCDIKMSDIENWTAHSKYIPFILYHNKLINIGIFFELYDKVIQLCVYWDNWKLLLCMWTGYSTYGRSYADFYLIPEIVKHCSKNTVIASLLAASSFFTENDTTFTPDDILKASKENKNADVCEFIASTYNKDPFFLGDKYYDEKFGENFDESKYDDVFDFFEEAFYKKHRYYIKQAKIAGILDEYSMALPCEPTK